MVSHLCARFALLWLSLGGVLLRAADVPALLEHDVVNAADHASGAVAPGEIVVLFPSNAGPPVMLGATAGADGKVPTLLGEARVLFDGIAAPMAYSVNGQLGAVVPYEVASRKTTEVVVEYQGVRSSAVTLPVADSAPGVFTLDLSGTGQAAMLNDTGCCNSSRNPAIRGTEVSLYATGEGETSPRGISGNVSTYSRIADYPVPRLPVQVTIGGEPAKIVYAGDAPHAVAGLLQVNFRVPAHAPIGNAVPVVLTVGYSRSADGITMAVRSSVQQILLIDEKAAVRRRLGKLLTSAGYEAFTAGSGAEALQVAKQHSVDLVISSLTSEAEKVEAIRGMRVERPQLKIIAMAGTLGPTTLRAADLFGAQGVLTDSMPPAAALRRVRAVLRAHVVAYVAEEQALPPILTRPIRR
jgi:uncharacterized protein (TIGR03437 family)